MCIGSQLVVSNGNAWWNGMFFTAILSSRLNIPAIRREVLNELRGSVVSQPVERICSPSNKLPPVPRQQVTKERAPQPSSLDQLRLVYYNIKLCTVVLIMVTCSHVKQPFYSRDVYHELYLTYYTVWNNFQPWLNTMHCNNLNVWICKVRILRYAPITSINGPPLSQWPLGLVPRVTDYSGSTVMGWNFLFWMIL